jgi:hypothetical protein
MNALLSLRPFAAALALVASATAFTHDVRADACCAEPEPVVVVVERPIFVEPQEPSWVFAPSTFTHDPATGARVAQYMRKPPIEPLPDQRAVTSRYRRTRTNLRGTAGSYETDYQVQAWGNGRGGIDAEWERFHDAWKESYLTGSYYQGPGYGAGYGGYPAYGGGYPGYGGPGYGYPGNGFPPQVFPHGAPRQRGPGKHQDRKDGRSFD